MFIECKNVVIEEPLGLEENVIADDVLDYDDQFCFNTAESQLDSQYQFEVETQSLTELLEEQRGETVAVKEYQVCNDFPLNNEEPTDTAAIVRDDRIGRHVETVVDDDSIGMADIEEELSDDDGNGNQSDEEYVAARQNTKRFRQEVVDTIYGLGLDEMLEAPGGVFDDDDHFEDGGLVGSAAIGSSHIESDYTDTDDGLLTPANSDEDDLEIRRKRKSSRSVYNPKCNHEELEFKVGMVFTKREQLRHVVQQWAICNGHDVRWTRSADDRLGAACKRGCCWRLYAAKVGTEKTFRIRKLEKKHTCQRATVNRQATSEWVAKEFIQRFRRNPTYPADDMMIDIKEKYKGLLVSKSTCYRARGIGMEIITGSLESHYAKFMWYDAELKRVD